MSNEASNEVSADFYLSEKPFKCLYCSKDLHADSFQSSFGLGILFPSRNPGNLNISAPTYWAFSSCFKFEDENIPVF